MSSNGNAQEALLQFLYMAPIGLIQTDSSGQIELMNPMAVQLLMPLLPDGELENLFESLKQQLPELEQLANQHTESNGMVCDSLRFALPLTNSSSRHHEEPRILALTLLKLDRDNLMACLSDVTTLATHEQERLAQSLEKAAQTDALTGLPNRTAAHRLLTDAIDEANQRAGSSVALLFLNCDRFNRINSTYGQQIGDALVRAIATRLVGLNSNAFGQSNNANSNSVVARLGGDEFVILIQHPTSCQSVMSEAVLLADSLSLPYQLDGHQIYTSISLGLSYRRTGDYKAPYEQLTADEVLQDASIAMRDAKRAGGGRCHLFVDQMRATEQKRGSLEEHLRKALAQDELYLEYQPIIDFHDTNRVSVEALVRWNSPELGIMPPGEFIGIAEETGLIVPLGLFVLRRACSQFAAWRLQSPATAPQHLSVNLSRAQLLEDKLQDQITQILAETSMPANCLQLEVTESLAAQNDAVCARLLKLQSMGIGIALDDFGTGYSSLSSLHQLPVNTVKIDQSFVRQLCESDHHRVLVQATVMVAKSLGMQTTAEGIETSEQAEQLRALHCDRGQGYFFGRPMNASALPDWIHQWQNPAQTRSKTGQGQRPENKLSSQ